MPHFFIGLLLLFPASLLAQDEIYSRVVQKHIKKVQQRWTVEDLYLRRKTAGMRRWSPWRSPMLELLVDFKFGPGQLYKTGVRDDDAKLSSLASQLQFHYGALGFGLDRTQTKVVKKNMYYKRDDFTLYYRIVGPSTQSTYFSLLAGAQVGEHNDYGELNHQFYGIMSNLYLFRHFGLEGEYKVRSLTETSSHRVSGMHYHWGIFWEFSILRLYLNFFQDYQKAQKKSDQTEQNQRLTSTVFGARLAF